MPSERRRSVLRAIALGGAGTLAGCQTRLWTDSTPTVEAVTPVDGDPTPVASGGWRSAQCDSARTRVNPASEAPVLEGDSQEMWWRADSSPSTPLLGTANALYVGTEVGTVFAVDPDEGTERWRASLATGCRGASLGPELLYVSTTDGSVIGFDAGGTPRCRIDLPVDDETTVTVADETVYAQMAEGPLFAIPTGLVEIEWSLDRGGSRLPPSVGDDVLVVKTDAALHGIGRDGAHRWRRPSDNLLGPPAISGNTGYTSREDGTLEAISLDTGEREWSTQFRSGFTWSPAVGERVYVSGSREESPFLAAFEHDGTVAWQVEPDVDATGSPVVAGDTVLVRGEGPVHGYDTTTGEFVGSRDVGHDSYLPSGSPIAVDGRLAVIDSHFEGTTYRVFIT